MDNYCEYTIQKDTFWCLFMGALKSSVTLVSIFTGLIISIIRPLWVIQKEKGPPCRGNLRGMIS